MKRSAGIILYRRRSLASGLEVLLGHMGGPFWARRDEGAWSIPKGEVDSDEELEEAARREFTEELGLPVPNGELVPLGEVKSSGKVITAWALDGDLEPGDVQPGTFDMEWPPGSGRMNSFPEIDRVDWFDLVTAEKKIVKSQRPLLHMLSTHTEERS